MAFSIRQRILKLIYPLLVSGRKNKSKIIKRDGVTAGVPVESFYSLSATLPDGRQLVFKKFGGKKVLLVNTASNCGYTAQYAELQKLYQHAKEDLEIIGFPANDFQQQEKGSDADIAAFCITNFGVSFPLAAKSSVIKGEGQNPVYQWLSNAAKNGWNNKAPEWNFSKYLVSEEGLLTHYFAPQVSPLSTEMMAAINQ